VIPGTLLGALFLTACLVPGFVFLRVAERRRAHLARSPAVELIELAAVGAAASLAAAAGVLLVARWTGIFDAAAFGDDPGRYVLEHPLRGLGPIAGTLAASTGLAALAARLLHKGPAAFDPAGSAWGRTLWDDRPSDRHVVRLIVELRDGRRVHGYMRAFTADLEDSRELALAKPLAAQAGPGARLEELDDDFLVLREDQIASLTGTYVLPGTAADTADSQRTGARIAAHPPRPQ